MCACFIWSEFKIDMSLFIKKLENYQILENAKIISKTVGLD